MIVQPEQQTALLATERLAEAGAQRRALRLRTARRLERRAEQAAHRARLVRLALQ